MFGDTDLERGRYFHLESLDSIKGMNADIQIETWAPGFTAFASDGGGEVYVFDAQGAIYLMPLIGMEPSAVVKIANSWTEFEGHIKDEP